MSQPKINACSQIQCPFFAVKPSEGRCPRYSHPSQCHLTTMFAFESDGYWLFNAKESELPQIEKANERFLTKDKASRKQLESLKKMKVSRKLELPIPPAIDYPGADTQLQPET